MEIGDNFVLEVRGSLSFLTVQHSLPVVFGFTGRPYDFSAQGDLEGSKASLQKALAVNSLALLKQIHSADLVDFNAWHESISGDAIIATYDQLLTKSQAIGIRTADCVPIILLGERNCAVIHAGWRGLAGGIVERSVSKLIDRGEKLSAFIGPCAGRDRYEVGEELIEKLPDGIFQPLGNGKYLLDLSQTTENKLKFCGVTRVVRGAPCTISNLDYHSYRRDGSPVGSNLAFVSALSPLE